MEPPAVLLTEGPLAMTYLFYSTPLPCFLTRYAPNFFFLNDTATPEIYSLPLPDALPILRVRVPVPPLPAVRVPPPAPPPNMVVKKSEKPPSPNRSLRSCAPPPLLPARPARPAPAHWQIGRAHV